MALQSVQPKKIYIWIDEADPLDTALAYYPMTSDLNDHSWNGYNLTWTATYSWNMATSTSTIYYNWQSLFWQRYWWDFTVMARMDFDAWESGVNCNIIIDASNWAWRPCFNFGGGVWIYKGYPQDGYGWVTCPSSWDHTKSGTHFMAVVRSGNTFYQFRDWVKNADTVTMSGYIWAWGNKTEYWPKFWNENNTTSHKTWRGWNVVIDNKARTDAQVIAFYNSTSSLYN